MWIRNSNKVRWWAEYVEFSFTLRSSFYINIFKTNRMKTFPFIFFSSVSHKHQSDINNSKLSQTHTSKSEKTIQFRTSHAVDFIFHESFFLLRNAAVKWKWIYDSMWETSYIYVRERPLRFIIVTAVLLSWKFWFIGLQI